MLCLLSPQRLLRPLVFLDFLFQVSRVCFQSRNHRIADPEEQCRAGQHNQQSNSGGEETRPDEGPANLGQVDLHHDPQVQHGHRLMGGQDRFAPVIEANDGSGQSLERQSHRLGQLRVESHRRGMFDDAVSMPQDEDDKVPFAPGQGELPRLAKPLVVPVGVDDLAQGGFRRSSRRVLLINRIVAGHRLHQAGLAPDGYL